MDANNQAAGLDTPVLFIVFNRPHTARRVFNAIREARPSRLFIAADGPREGKEGEIEKCEEVRRLVGDVDWKCDVATLFGEKNLGCGKGPAAAISWFFSHVEEGIILEDDCLPSSDFFRFCSEMLAKYRYDSRIMQVAGNNMNLQPAQDERHSYFFSNHNYIWGWATWRRSWKFFNFDMKYYDEVRTKRYHDGYFKSLDEQVYMKYVFDQTYANLASASVWDYQWQFARMLQAGLAVVPYRNLVVNIGSGEDATHTTKHKEILPDLKLEPMDFPLRHPDFVMANLARDEKMFVSVFTTRWWRIRQRMKLLLPNFLVEVLKNMRFKR